MDVSRRADGAEMTVQLTNEDAHAEVCIETRPARVVITDAAERDIEVDLEGMLYGGVVVGEGLDLDDHTDPD